MTETAWFEDAASRIAGSDDIKHIHKTASVLNYNRILRDDLIEELDPDGLSLIVPAMIHKHAQGVEVAPHIRAFAYLATAGNDHPIRAIMDIPMDIWESLPETAITLPGDPRNG